VGCASNPLHRSTRYNLADAPKANDLLIRSRHTALFCVTAAVLVSASMPGLAQTTGASGATGAQVPKPIVLRPPVAKGASGVTGAQAVSGAAARPAATVPAPVPGSPGTILTKSFAVSGASGATGSAKPKTAVGASGSTGVSGATGLSRPKAVAGSPGATGVSGVTGSTKPKVAGGASGVTGQAASAPGPAVSSSPGFNRTLILLDPAHGGMDSGSRIGDSVLEKDVTLALAFKLKSLLQARGLTVQLTRDNDTPMEPNSPANPLTLDDRAGQANHSRAAACLLLHATGAGTGVHLYTSELDAAAGEPAVQPWLTAQAAWVPQSQKLEKQLATALTRARIPLVTSAASVRPVDSLTCPALVIELAPSDSDDPGTINDSSYQQHVAEAIATSLVFWQGQVQAPVKLGAPAASGALSTSGTGDAGVTP